PTMSSLNLNTMDLVEGIDCEQWSVFIKEKKTLCWGGDVSFLFSKEIGEAVFMKLTFSDSNISTLLSLIGFDECGKQSLKTHVCTCTSDNGNKSFHYTCTKTFNISHSESIISAEIQDVNGRIVQRAQLRLPPFSKETNLTPELRTVPEKDEPAPSTPDSRRTSEQSIPDLFIGVLVGLTFGLIIALAFSIRLNCKQRKKIKKLKGKGKSDKELKVIKSGYVKNETHHSKEERTDTESIDLLDEKPEDKDISKGKRKMEKFLRQLDQKPAQESNHEGHEGTVSESISHLLGDVEKVFAMRELNDSNVQTRKEQNKIIIDVHNYV
ncbi:hypothetical protein BgiBS90_019384, partial [Biomphalaria glabrata]